MRVWRCARVGGTVEKRARASTTPTFVRPPFSVQTSGRRSGSAIRLGCPDRRAVQGDDFQGPPDSVAAGRGSGTQGTSGQMPAGHWKVTVPTASPRGLSVVCAVLALGVQMGTESRPWPRSPLREKDRKQEEEERRVVRGEQGDGVTEGGQRRPCRGSGLGSVTGTRQRSCCSVLWGQTLLLVSGAAAAVTRWSECLSQERTGFLESLKCNETLVFRPHGRGVLTGMCPLCCPRGRDLRPGPGRLAPPPRAPAPQPPPLHLPSGGHLASGFPACLLQVFCASVSVCDFKSFGGFAHFVSLLTSWARSRSWGLSPGVRTACRRRLCCPG